MDGEEAMNRIDARMALLAGIALDDADRESIRAELVEVEHALAELERFAADVPFLAAQTRRHQAEARL